MTYQEYYEKFSIIFQEMIVIFGEDAVKEWAGWREKPVLED